MSARTTKVICVLLLAALLLPLVLGLRFSFSRKAEPVQWPPLPAMIHNGAPLGRIRAYIAEDPESVNESIRVADAGIPAGMLNPLAAAVGADRMDVARLLIEKGASVELTLEIYETHDIFSNKTKLLVWLDEFKSDSGADPRELADEFVRTLVEDPAGAHALMEADFRSKTKPDEFAAFVRETLLPDCPPSATVEFVKSADGLDQTTDGGEASTSTEYHYRILPGDGKAAIAVEVDVVRHGGRHYVRRVLVPRP